MLRFFLEDPFDSITNFEVTTFQINILARRFSDVNVIISRTVIFIFLQTVGGKNPAPLVMSPLHPVHNIVFRIRRAWPNHQTEKCFRQAFQIDFSILCAGCGGGMKSGAGLFPSTVRKKLMAAAPAGANVVGSQLRAAAASVLTAIAASSNRRGLSLQLHAGFTDS